MMRSMIIFVTGGFLAVVLMSTAGQGNDSGAVGACVSKFKSDSRIFSNSAFALRAAIDNIQAGDPGSVAKARQLLAHCRMHYKSLEFFLTYFFPTEAVTYNMPPKTEVEEQPNLELTEPVGLQVVESLLYATDVFAQKDNLIKQMGVICSSAEDIPSLLFNFRGSEQQLLESVRLELIRIMALGISGYDAPLLKTGIAESYAALVSVNRALQPLLVKGEAFCDSISLYMQQSLQFLQANTAFDGFDRLKFLTDCALPLQYHLGSWIRQTGREINSTAAISYDAPHLFDPEFFVKKAFASSAATDNTALAGLGRALFFDRSLSGNNVTSCASCHDPSLYFSDGMAKSRAFNQHSLLPRNAPSIMYSVFQYGQGWDGSVPGLEAQVIKVLYSPEEMNVNSEVMIEKLRKNNGYRSLFREAFPASGDSAVSVRNIASAIASFVRTCNPFTTPFDLYMRGDRSALSASEKNGFNLFMGKAQCGTCHFVPLFNGLTPPLYDISEVEVIGVPATSQLDHPSPDNDRGRYLLYPIRPYDKAFKTPGLRNVARTAPYMHNGSFATLEQVLDFYNRGGLEGIGLALPNQTLSPEPLKLSEQEMADIIHFMEALTDTLPAGKGGAAMR